MENNNLQMIEVAQTQQTQVEFDYQSFFRKCLKKWYWFFITAILCLGAAVLYILQTKPEYERTATVLFKDSEKSTVSASDLESLLAIGSSQVSTKVVNEVIAFQSPALMLQVVERLALSTSYGKKNLLREDVIYGHQVPVSVEFLDIPSFYSTSFALNPKEEGYRISELRYAYNGEKYEVEEEVSASLKDTVQTAVGRIVVTKSDGFTGDWNEPVIVHHSSNLAVSEHFLRNFTAGAVDNKNKADVIKLTMKDNSVQRADDILNTIIEIFNENWILDRNTMAVSTTEFINERLVSLEKELGDVDKDISSYKSEKLIPDVETVSSLLADQTRENTRLIQELDNELYVYRYIFNYLSDAERANQLIPMAGSISNSGISTQILDYNKMLLNRNNLLANSSESNPLVKDLTASLIPSRKAIETSISNQISTLEDQLAHLKAVEGKTKTKIAENPSQVEYLTTVGRQQKVKETIYLYLLQKREENELSQAFTPYNTRVITPPMGIAKPVAPAKMKILIEALLFGLLIPLICIYFSTLLDNKVHSKKDFGDVQFPFLGEIPQYDKKSGNKVLVQEGNRDILNESFRVVRTNIEFVSKGTEHPVMLVSSYEPGSGKSFVSINLSMALAIKGHKVLVIDGDMRHASLSVYANNPHHGLSSYLCGSEKDWKSSIVQMPNQANLSILPVGTIPPNPSELIAGERFSKLISEAKKEYDYVLVDCPPLEMVADTRIIAQYADRCLFIARAGVFEKGNLSLLKRLGSEQLLKNLSIILNGTDTAGSYGGRYGYHSYGYYGSKA